MVKSATALNNAWVSMKIRFNKHHSDEAESNMAFI